MGDLGVSYMLQMRGCRSIALELGYDQLSLVRMGGIQPVLHSTFIAKSGRGTQQSQVLGTRLLSGSGSRHLISKLLYQPGLVL